MTTQEAISLMQRSTNTQAIQDMLMRRPSFNPFTSSDFVLSLGPAPTPPVGSEEYVKAAEEAGFGAVTSVLAYRSSELEQASKLRAKLAQATEHYPWLTQEQVSNYRKKLRWSTERRVDRWTFKHEDLKFESLGDYSGLPPMEVLTKVQEAKARSIFDSYQVISVTTVTVDTRPIQFLDPIVVASIMGDPRLFVIAQWGDDVKYEDIVRA